MIDLRQTKKYAQFMRSIGWKVERIEDINYFIRPFPLMGSFMKIQRPHEVRYEDIKILREKYRVFHTIIEPRLMTHDSLIINHGFKQSTPYLPSKTLLVDSTKTENQLLKEMHHKTRYNIKVAQKRGVAVSESKDIYLFADLWRNQKMSRRFLGTKDITELYKAFGKDAHLFLAYNNKELLGGVLCIHANDIAYYMYAAATHIGKRLHAPTLLAWEQIRLAKKLKCRFFDFEGIYDERFPLRDWKGFSRFKKSFGGKEVEYPGAFARVKLRL